MIDAKTLLDRFLSPAAPGQGGQGSSPASSPGGASPWLQPGASSGGGLGGMAEAARQAAQQALGGRGLGGMGGYAAGGAAGGVLGLLLGGKRKKKKGGFGGVLSHGAAAMLGALASRAYENWQSGRNPASAPLATPQDAARVEPRYLPPAAPAADGQPFELALVRAMIAAAKADGHIDAEEHQRIFARVEALELDAEGKAFVFDALSAAAGPAEIAASARTEEQAAELYLASRLAVDPDQPAERAYLQALAHRLKLPPGLAEHLDRQADAAAEGAAG
ncbi:tellurite resistance TerB family protein [Pseudoroseomonas cervicalis]|uniref:tellurite resistance TerB family protein n=1 Tax=Teichococcus cervicalis TaxID=204525 RepID=UPI0022F1DC1A|nr:tellurite resistance TerB family protein [Pseudoroseomonas cervicalis]WBV44807.1 tellurite resistance TerB family protein [Pseudoroseomonas cervicalis]